MSELMCLVCMYVRPRPDIESTEELSVLTVVNGQMVCMRHVSCAQHTYSDTIRNGVLLESAGTMTSLSAYQDWRGKQDKDNS